jgi:hypothetical protein
MLASFFICKVLQALESTLLHIQLVEHTFYPEVKRSEREDALSYRSDTKGYTGLFISPSGISGLCSTITKTDTAALNFIPKSHRDNYTVGSY